MDDKTRALLGDHEAAKLRGCWWPVRSRRKSAKRSGRWGMMRTAATLSRAAVVSLNGTSKQTRWSC